MSETNKKSQTTPSETPKQKANNIIESILQGEPKTPVNIERAKLAARSGVWVCFEYDDTKEYWNEVLSEINNYKPE